MIPEVKERLPPPRKLAVILLVLAVVLSVGAIALTDSASVQGTIPLNATDGPEVVLKTPTDSFTQLDLTTAFPDSGTVDVTHENANGTFTGAAGTSVTVATSDLEGSETLLTSISTSAGDLTVNPADKRRVTIGGGMDSLTFQNATVDDGNAEFDYSASSSASVTLQDVGVSDRQISAVAGDGTIVGATTTSSDGTATFSNLDSGSYSDVRLVTSSPPSLSNESPADGSGTTDSPVTLAIDVDDDDFDNGDSVNVTFEAKYEDNSTFDTVGSETISSAQRVNASYTPETLGTHEWRVTAVDEQGNTVESQTFTFDTPNTITVVNESDPEQIIDGGVETTFRFFGPDQVFTRNSTNGTIDMTGLPDEEFTLTVSADGNYTSRTVHINSIFEQETVYLLADDVDTVESRFILNDPTGNFGPDTKLYIEKAITENGTTTYKTIVADSFGAEGVTARLERDQRYRLKIESSTGITQIIGPYRASDSETVEVTPGQPTIGVGDSSTTWSVNTDIDNTTLEYRYDDPEQLTDKVTVSIYERGNKSNELVPEESYFDLGTASAQVELTEEQANTEWVVEFEITRDGETFTKTQPASGEQNLIPDLDPMWKTFAAIALLFMSAGAFSVLNAGVGAVVISVQGGVLWWIGWLEGATAGAGVAIALFISVLVAIWKSTGT